MAQSRFGTRASHTLHRIASLLLLGAICVSPLTSARAETTDFGGYPDRFHGEGDKTPPRCQIDLPRASTEAFFIQWNCADDYTDPQDIRTELWIYRHGAPAGVRLASFLGFPASVKVDESVLLGKTFAEGLPASFRLIAIDRAGVSSLSPLLTVSAQDNGVTTCTLKVDTPATQSSGSTTGTPASSVVLSDAAVSVSDTSNTAFRISTPTATEAVPCEIDVLCFNGHDVSFAAALASSTTGSTDVTGTLSITPGSLTVNVKGTSTVSGVVLDKLDVSGPVHINGVDGTVTLSCAR